MGIKDMISTGAMIIVGIIALKAFGGVKGLTSMIGGVGELLGTGGPAAGGIDLITPGDVEQIEAIRGLTTEEVELIAETKQVEATYDVLGMMGWVAGPFGALVAPRVLAPFEEGQKAAIIDIFAGDEDVDPGLIDPDPGTGGITTGITPTPRRPIIPQPVSYPTAGKPWSKFLQDIA